MTATRRYRYAFLIALLGLGALVAIVFPQHHPSTEVTAGDEPTTTPTTVPPTITSTAAPETTTSTEPPTTVAPTTVAPAAPIDEPIPVVSEPVVPAENQAAAEIPDAPAHEATAPAVRVETACTNDPNCTAPPSTEPEYRQPPDWAACPQWWETAQAAGWPAEAMDRVDFVMKHESGCNPEARNPSGATGLMQLMPMHWRGKFDPTDPFMNLQFAHRLWESSGWAPWQVCGFRRGC